MTEDEIRDLFKKHDVPLSMHDVWSVQKALVVKHKALERLAGELGVTWAAPVVLRAGADEAVILATGRLGDREEWSVGEARVVPMDDTGRLNKWKKPIYEPRDGCIGNYQITPKQAAYPWAMAEKRAKDRVILKLAGLHGAYSEDESDEFRATEPADAPAAQQIEEPAEESREDSRTLYLKEAAARIDSGEWATDAGLLAWWNREEQVRHSFGFSEQDAKWLLGKLKARLSALRAKVAA